MVQDKICWVSKNKGDKEDKLLLAGYQDQGGYYVGALLDFALGGDVANSKNRVLRGSQKSKFWKFYQRWKNKHKTMINEA